MLNQRSDNWGNFKLTLEVSEDGRNRSIEVSGSFDGEHPDELPLGLDAKVTGRSDMTDFSNQETYFGLSGRDERCLVDALLVLNRLRIKAGKV